MLLAVVYAHSADLDQVLWAWDVVPTQLKEPLRHHFGTDPQIHTRHQDLQNFALPQHPNTTEGRAAYQAQVAVWHTANPNRKPDEQHLYPLMSGTPAVRSRECWDCGQKGHMQSAPICAGAILPEPERDWRRIAGFIACAFNTERLANNHAVNFISV
jgi:hypothetical protein